MLTTMEVYHMKHLRVNKGLSLRAIAKETGRDFRTVKKYVEQDDFNQVVKQKRKRASRLDPYKPTIDELLEKDKTKRSKSRLTARGIYKVLCRDYKEFDLSERTVRKYVSEKKKELYSDNKGYLPLSHPEGEGQADFGEEDFEYRGKTVRLHYLNLSYPNSNNGYFQVFEGENLECFLEGLQRIFEHTEKVPQKIWFDNLTPVVQKILNVEDRAVNERFQFFCLHYGFEAVFCNPYSGHEKGNVEKKVGYHRKNFLLLDNKIDNLDAYNKKALAYCDADMDRPHYLKEKSIRELFEVEKEKMLDLNEKPFEVHRLKKAKANKYGMVTFETNRYAVSPTYAQRQVWLKIKATEIAILDEDYRPLIKYPRLYNRNQQSMNWSPYLELLCRRPRALEYTGFFEELPTNWQTYFKGCDYWQKKDTLKVLTKILQQNDMETAQAALEEAIKGDECTAETIMLSYRKITQQMPSAYEPGNGIPRMVAYEINLNAYDELASVCQ